MGLLDSIDDPTMSLAMGLLSAGGPSRTPVSFGQGLASGWGAYQDAARRQQAMQMQRDAFNLDQQRGQLGMQKGQLELDEIRRRMADADKTREILQGAFAAGGQPGAGGVAAATQGMAGAPIPGGATPAAIPQSVQGAQQSAPGGVTSKADVWQRYKSLGDLLASKGQVDAAQQYYGLAEKFRPKYKADSRTVRMPDGSIATVNMSEDGSEVVSGYTPAEKLVQIDLGGGTGFGDPFTGKPVAGTFQRKTMTPGEIASNSLGWANNNLSKQRLGFDQQQAMQPQFKDGYWVAPPRPGQATGQIIETPLSSPAKGSPQANMNASQRILPLLDQADSLLGKSTSSYIGTGVDLAAQAFGGSTKGAQAAAQLKALEGAIMMAQPRMEGPQSDKDVALYRQMAGQIGDSTVPIKTRRAALNGIRQLHERYATGGGMTSGASGGWSATLVK